MIGRFSVILDSYQGEDNIRVRFTMVNGKSDSSNYIYAPASSLEEGEQTAKYIESVLYDKHQEQINELLETRNQMKILTQKAQQQLRDIKQQFKKDLQEQNPEVFV